MEKFSERFKLNPNIKLRETDLQWYQEYNSFFNFISEYFHYHKPIVISPMNPMRRQYKDYKFMLQRSQDLISTSSPLIPISDLIEIDREVFNRFFIELMAKIQFYRLLHVLRNFPNGIRFFNNNRRKYKGVQRNQINFVDEYDFQDYLGLILQSNFDLIHEFTIPPKSNDSQGGKVEFYIPKCHALVECKFINSVEKKKREEHSVRSKQITYTNIHSLTYLIFVFWDETNVISNPVEFERKNSCSMIIDDNRFEVIFIVSKL